MPQSHDIENSIMGINPDMFGYTIQACTRSYFCDQASPEAKHHIARTAGVSLAAVEAQALPNTGTPSHPTCLANYNLQGTGSAYRKLIKEGILDISDKTAHAAVVDPLSKKA